MLIVSLNFHPPVSFHWASSVRTRELESKPAQEGSRKGCEVPCSRTVMLVLLGVNTVNKFEWHTVQKRNYPLKSCNFGHFKWHWLTQRLNVEVLTKWHTRFVPEKPTLPYSDVPSQITFWRFSIFFQQKIGISSVKNLTNSALPNLKTYPFTNAIICDGTSL